MRDLLVRSKENFIFKALNFVGIAGIKSSHGPQGWAGAPPESPTGWGPDGWRGRSCGPRYGRKVTKQGTGAEALLGRSSAGGRGGAAGGAWAERFSCCVSLAPSVEKASHGASWQRQILKVPVFRVGKKPSVELRGHKSIAQCPTSTFLSSWE